MPDTAAGKPAQQLRGGAKINREIAEARQRAAEERDSALQAAMRMMLGAARPGDDVLAARFAGVPGLVERLEAQRAERRTTVRQHSIAFEASYDAPVHGPAGAIAGETLWDLRDGKPLQAGPSAMQQRRSVTPSVPELASEPVPDQFPDPEALSALGGR